MKKLFALALIAGSLSFFACGDNDTTKTDGDGTDTTKVENNTTIENNTTNVDTMNNGTDTGMNKMGNDTMMKK